MGKGWSGMYHHVAMCHDCPWKCDARNAMAVGARHAEHHRHHVGVELGYSFRGDNLASLGK